MTKNETVGLSLRIASIFFVLSVLQKTVATIPEWNRVGEVSTTAIVFMLIVPLMFAGILWKFAFYLSKILLPPTTPTAEDIRWSLADIETTAFTIIGIYVLSGAIPDGFYLTSVFIQSSALKADLGQAPSITLRFISIVIKLIIGFWLLLGAKGLRDFLYKVRSAGKRI